MKQRGNRKTVVGLVSADKMDKTIVVRAMRLVKHKRYGKILRRYTVYKAHDENNEARVGDKVEIAETRPLSKTKRWRLVRILERSGAPALLKEQEDDSSPDQT